MKTFKVWFKDYNQRLFEAYNMLDVMEHMVHTLHIDVTQILRIEEVKGDN